MVWGNWVCDFQVLHKSSINYKPPTVVYAVDKKTNDLNEIQSNLQYTSKVCLTFANLIFKQIPTTPEMRPIDYGAPIPIILFFKQTY